MKLNMVDVCGDGVQRGEVFKVSCRWLELNEGEERAKQAGHRKIMTQSLS